MSELKEFFKETIEQCIEEYNEFDIQEWSNIFLEYKNNFINFPKVEDKYNIISLDDEDEEYGEVDEIDFENFYILSINLDSNEFIIVAHGEWQEPYEMNIIYNNDNFYFENPVRNDNFLEMNEEEILKIIEY